MAVRDESMESADSGPRRSGLLRKTAIGLAGGGLIAAGVVMLVTPGPGVLTIVGGMTVLAREFPVADRAVKRVRRNTIDKIRPFRERSDRTIGD